MPDDDTLASTLKTPWSNGTTHLLLSPLELIEKLAALVPRPHANLIRYHGVLAPNAAGRAHIVPGLRVGLLQQQLGGSEPDITISTKDEQAIHPFHRSVVPRLLRTLVPARNARYRFTSKVTKAAGSARSRLAVASARTITDRRLRETIAGPPPAVSTSVVTTLILEEAYCD